MSQGMYDLLWAKETLQFLNLSAKKFSVSLFGKACSVKQVNCNSLTISHWVTLGERE